MTDSKPDPKPNSTTDALVQTALLPAVGAAEHPVLSVGIVGAGEIVSRIHLPVLCACEGVRVAYVADKSTEAARSVGANYNISAITVADQLEDLPQTDVVLLAVPVNARLPYYELFARRGTCVLAEKPMAADSSDAVRICDLFPAHALACGFQRRSYASVALAKLIVAEKWFGRLRSISVSEGALTTKTGADSRFYDHSGSAGGVLMDLGCHSLDTAIYISNATAAVSSRQSFIFDGEVDREIDAQLTLHTADGPCALEYFVTWLRPARNTIQFHFDNCTAELSCRPSSELTIRGIHNGGDAASLGMKHAGAATVYQAFYTEWMAFLAGVRTRQPSMFNARSCLATICAVESLYREGKRKP